ncbi:hypothetical protein [Streptomyces sp. cg2]|uniref:hypothetical protein n=1 Tax=Streptomyces sp. cg2 TaxID=3238799 RepID=UPI0034E30369
MVDGLASRAVVVAGIHGRADFGDDVRGEHQGADDGLFGLQVVGRHTHEVTGGVVAHVQYLGVLFVRGLSCRAGDLLFLSKGRDRCLAPAGAVAVLW